MNIEEGKILPGVKFDLDLIFPSVSKSLAKWTLLWKKASREAEWRDLHGHIRFSDSVKGDHFMLDAYYEWDAQEGEEVSHDY